MSMHSRLVRGPNVDALTSSSPKYGCIIIFCLLYVPKSDDPDSIIYLLPLYMLYASLIMRAREANDIQPSY